ncbi:hypothetical protein A7K92_26955 [Klebsiella pneumoniae]|nr:hypothetical protein A7K92_26955 [Klebsiella pneumoniae]
MAIRLKKDQLLGVIDPEQAQNQIKEVEATLMELQQSVLANRQTGCPAKKLTSAPRSADS